MLANTSGCFLFLHNESGFLLVDDPTSIFFAGGPGNMFMGSVTFFNWSCWDRTDKNKEQTGDKQGEKTGVKNSSSVHW